MSNTNKPNLEWLSFSEAIVRTQAGFKKAVKEYEDKGCGEWMGHNYPTTYPSVVTFSEYYSGYHGIGLVSEHVNSYLERYEKEAREKIEILKRH